MDIDCEIDNSFSSDTSEEHALCLSKEEISEINAALAVHVGPFAFGESIIASLGTESVESLICNGIFKAAALYNDLPGRRKLKIDKDTITRQYQKLNLTQVTKLLQLGQKNEWAAIVYDGLCPLPCSLMGFDHAYSRSPLAISTHSAGGRSEVKLYDGILLN